MRYRKLDANGDYSLGTGADFHINTPAAVAQAVSTGLRLFAGEWFLDARAGFPWRTEVLGKYTQSGYDVLLKEQILSSPGVTEITDYASSFDTAARKLTVSAKINTVYGPATIQTTF